MNTLSAILLVLTVLLTVVFVPSLIGRAGDGKWSWGVYFRGLTARGWVWSTVVLINTFGPFPDGGLGVVLPPLEGILFSMMVVAAPTTLVAFASGVQDRRKLTFLTVAVVLGILTFLSLVLVFDTHGPGLPFVHWFEPTPEPRGGEI